MAVGFVFAGAEGEVYGGRARRENTYSQGELAGGEMMINIVGKHFHHNNVVSTAYLHLVIS